jgi:hypothetical protein
MQVLSTYELNETIDNYEPKSNSLLSNKQAIQLNQISKKNRQNNDQQKRYKGTNNDLQNIHIKLKIEEHEPIQFKGDMTVNSTCPDIWIFIYPFGIFKLLGAIFRFLNVIDGLFFPGKHLYNVTNNKRTEQFTTLRDTLQA